MVPRQPGQRPPPPQRMASATSAKLSFQSHSSSFEADDERSSSADQDSMGPDSTSRRRIPSQYAGEDTRLTSKKELSGWYAYGFAAEVFVICGMGSFIPITLEQLARENGVLLSDRTTPCGSSSKARPPIEDAVALLSRLVSTTKPKDNGQCIVYILGMEINTASFAMYTFSISVLIQSLLVISISCAADHGNFRKRLLLLFAWCGAIATMLFLPVVSEVYILAALFAIISNTCFGASFVLLNSFLPLLVRHHPKAQYGEDTSAEHYEEASVTTNPENLSSSTSGLLETPGSLSAEKPTSVELQLSTEISSKGIGIGYSAGLFVQCCSIVILVAMKSSTLSLRLVLFIIGLWWFIFTIPTALWLRPRPGPPLPTSNSADISTRRTWIGYIAHSWMSLFRTISLTPSLPDILLFLLAWFLLSDAIATVSGVAILFAKTELHMSPAALALISVTATTSGILGAFTWPIISRYFHIRPVNTILCCIGLFEIIPVYGLAGYLPFVQHWGVGGLQQPWEMYALGLIYGFVLGGLSSYCRSLYGELIPPGSEAAFYALYAITDKGSSIFGPAIVGMIVDRTGGIRPAFWFLMLLVGLPAPLIWFVDVGRGKEAGKRLAETIEGFRIKAIDESGVASGGEAGEERELLAANEDEEEEN